MPKLLYDRPEKQIDTAWVGPRDETEPSRLPPFRERDSAGLTAQVSAASA
jgi:hypothetical protein